MRRIAYLIALSVFCLGLSACNFGEVDQGRCVAYDKDAKSFTLVLDVKHDMKNPEYSGGVHTYTMPAEPKEIGPEPVPGGLVQLMPDKNQVIIFANGDLATIPVEFVSIEKVKASDAKVKGQKFPVIDKAAGTVTEYYANLTELVTFKVSSEYLDMPGATWNAGDECRIYYKPNEKHQALRFMNVSKTNIFKK